MEGQFSNGYSGPFTALVERLGGVPIVRVYGEVDISTVPRMEEACAEASALRDGMPYMVVDLSGVTFMDSTGIGALIGQRNTLGAQTLWLVLGDGGAGRTMRVAGVDVAFRVSPDLEAALREVRGESGGCGVAPDPVEG